MNQNTKVQKWEKLEFKRNLAKIVLNGLYISFYKFTFIGSIILRTKLKKMIQLTGLIMVKRDVAYAKKNLK